MLKFIIKGVGVIAGTISFTMVIFELLLIIANYQNGIVEIIDLSIPFIIIFLKSFIIYSLLYQLYQKKYVKSKNN